VPECVAIVDRLPDVTHTNKHPAFSANGSRSVGRPSTDTATIGAQCAPTDDPQSPVQLSQESEMTYTRQSAARAHTFATHRLYDAPLPFRSF